jgi:hypothetical protein
MPIAALVQALCLRATLDDASTVAALVSATRRRGRRSRIDGSDHTLRLEEKMQSALYDATGHPRSPVTMQAFTRAVPRGTRVGGIRLTRPRRRRSSR